MSQTDVKVILEELHKINDRIDDMDRRMITKADVFQAVMTVQAFTAASIVGTVVVLNAIGALA